MNEKILVIGASGKVGSALVTKLASQKVSVNAATRNPDNYPINNKYVNPVKVDFEDESTFAPAFDGVTKLFIMSKPLDVNVADYLSKFIDIAKNKGINKIVMLSAIGVDLNDAAPLRKVEKLVEASGIEYTILRPNFFMDNFYPGYLYHSIKESGKFFLPADYAKTSFISVDDIAEAGVNSLLKSGHENKGYTLTGPEAIDHKEAAAIMSEFIGSEVNYVNISDEDMRNSFKGFGMPDSEIEYMSMLYGAVRAGYTEPVDSTLESVIGRKATSFKEFMTKNSQGF